MLESWKGEPRGPWQLGVQPSRGETGAIQAYQHNARGRPGDAVHGSSTREARGRDLPAGTRCLVGGERLGSCSFY